MRRVRKLVLIALRSRNSLHSHKLYSLRERETMSAKKSWRPKVKNDAENDNKATFERGKGLIDSVNNSPNYKVEGLGQTLVILLIDLVLLIVSAAAAMLTIFLVVAIGSGMTDAAYASGASNGVVQIQMSTAITAGLTCGVVVWWPKLHYALRNRLINAIYSKRKKD